MDFRYEVAGSSQGRKWHIDGKNVLFEVQNYSFSTLKNKKMKNKQKKKKVEVKTSFARLVSDVCHSILSPLVTSQQDGFKTFEPPYKYGSSLFLARIFSII